MGTTRRQFIKQTGSLALGAAGLSVLPGSLEPRAVLAASDAESSARPTLVVLYLRGGSDPLSTLVPYGDQTYYNIRPTIAIPGPDKPRGVIPLSRYFGFHPSMAGLARLYKKKLMAAVINTGSTHPTRSHFDAQDFMERAAPGIKTVTEGWLNRFLYTTRTSHDSDLRAVAFQPVLPRSLRGQYPALAVPDMQAQKAADAFAAMYACDDAKRTAEAQLSTPEPGSSEKRIITAGSQALTRLNRLRDALKQSPTSPQAKYPNTELGRRFKDIAKLIKANVGLEITAVDYNGWDHHAMQGGSQGVFSRMMDNVSRTLEAFVADLGSAINRTVVMTMSEFGRTARENGNSGSDHGHGGYMLLVGGRVNGGKVYGKWTGLGSRSLYEGRDLPVHTDFRDVFAEVLAALYGFTADDHQFFPEYDANDKPLGLIRRV